MLVSELPPEAPSPLITPITSESFQHMSVEEKVQRMDLFFEQLRRERDPFYERQHDFRPFLHHLTPTSVYVQHPEQGKLAWMFFDLLLQGDYITSYGGFSTTVHGAKDGWASPSNHVFFNSLEQATIIGSRIEFERLMRFIYFAFEEKEFDKKSTFAPFKNWLLSQPIDSDLIYLIPFLKTARRHDRDHRTAEVHTGSKLKSRTLALENKFGQEDAKLDLHNCVTNLTRNMLPLLNFERPSSASGQGADDLGWLGSYATKDLNALTQFRSQWERDLAALG
jgi:hypothetical protein